MKNIIAITILIILNLTIVSASNDDRNNYYDIVTLGAKPNSKSDSSKALKMAWDMACDSPGQSTINIPEGRFNIRKPLKLDGKGCLSSRIDVIINGTIVAPSDFHVLQDSGTLVLFHDVDGVTVTGGLFDGRGAKLWACKRSGNDDCPRGVTTLAFRNSRNIEINGITSLDSQLYHIVISGSQNVRVQGVTISASGQSPNTDGIHVQSSTDVTILSSDIATGDDCISIGQGTRNLWIQDITCGPGHGISIGSLGKDLHESRVQNVTVITSTFTNTENGVRIKSWGRPSDGSVSNVLFQHLTMENVRNPIIIDQKYCPSHKDCPGDVSGIRVSDVTYEDIHGSSATPIAVKFDCSSKHYCSGIKLHDIHLTHKNKRASAFCSNCEGSTYGVVQPKSCLIEVNN
ncbi:polygalacturonase-like [Spinacia oleracea]|uniref:Polygalacturonase-like n=1 Tax=Spinacia oleracea TaxID=3562 RepID=A0ABM3RNL5_SPIOL|nr:polygalacturonase-like [Spinacia oleracea]